MASKRKRKITLPPPVKWPEVDVSDPPFLLPPEDPKPN